MDIRVMDLADLEVALGWAADEGWNPGFDDAAAFLAADPEGFFLGSVDGTPAAAISVVNHDDSFAFLGLYICRPEYRGQGHGYALWQHALKHAGDRSVGLDGVPAEQDNYRKSGFDLKGQTFRYEGNFSSRISSHVRAADPTDIQALITLDRGFQGYERPAFLNAWYAPAPGRQTLVFGRGNGLEGVVTWRRCRAGAKIGPFQAPDMDVARALLETVAANAETRPLIIDVPDDQSELTSYCLANGMTASFNTARMVRGMAPVSGGGIQSVATLELG